MNIQISESIKYIGVDDKDIDLFESQYVVPNGVSYNSYLIVDEKIAIMDTVDGRKTEEWLEKLANALEGRTPDYLIISHLEPDHFGSMEAAVAAYPNLTLVLSGKALTMLSQFTKKDYTSQCITVAEGEELSLGKHTLQFFMAPMVHWPEVMVEYEKTEKVLFSADAFGKFGALDTDEDWACEARRYYFNIVGKYGGPAATLLKKASTLDIATICPLHGPILQENLSYYIDKYATWSSYKPENKGVLIAYASIHGNTGEAAKRLGAMLEELGEEKVVVSDLAREDMAEVIEDAFRYDAMILACATYDGGLFPCMESFLAHLKSKMYQGRTVGFMENGSWAPMAAKQMQGVVEGFKNIKLLEQVVTLRSTLKETDEVQLKALAEAVVNRQ